LDRRFLAAYLPEIENWLHYRSIDVSSVKELVKRWYPKVDNGRPYKQGTHRALDDIRESINELRYYRQHVFVESIAKVQNGDGAAAPEAQATAAAPEDADGG
jgi:oligoribonuclease